MENIGYPPEINQFLIKKAPSQIVYIPNFISQEEVDSHLRFVDQKTWTKNEDSGMQIQSFGFHEYVNGKTKSYEAIPEEFGSLIERVTKLVRTRWAHAEAPKFVRVNRYLPGVGINPHRDNRSIGGLTALVTLGNPSLLDFYKPAAEGESNSDPEKIGSVYLVSGSLLIFAEEAYSTYLHGIMAKTFDEITPDVYNAPELQGQTIKRDVRTSIRLKFNIF